MRRFLPWLLLAAAVAPAAEERAPRITAAEVTAPVADAATGIAFTRTSDGAVRLSWVEPAAAGANALRFSPWSPSEQKWAGARTIAHDQSVAANAADAPQLAFEAGRGFALWTDGKGGARLAQSADDGATWARAARFATEDRGIEMPTLVRLGNGRVLAAWLAGDNPKRLHRRFLDEPARAIVDASVCDCCPPALTAFPDGTALLAYRGRTAEEVRDIQFTRVRAGAADEPHVLNNDDWRLQGCPVNGPRLASDGGRVAAAWFTAADNDPRVLATFSPDAGARFLMPLRVDRGKSTGHVDVALLHDGAILVTWLENDGSLWLRRVTPDFAPDEPTPLAPAGTVPTRAFPRVALVRDYTGGTTPAQLMVAFATEKALRTLLVTVPEGELLEAEKNCECAPTAEQLRGFPLRGTIREVTSSAGGKTARIEHYEVPGIFERGTRAFQVAPDAAGQLETGRQFLGRIEQRAGAWWLFDVRLLAAPPR